MEVSATQDSVFPRVAVHVQRVNVHGQIVLVISDTMNYLFRYIILDGWVKFYFGFDEFVIIVVMWFNILPKNVQNVKQNFAKFPK